MTQNEHLPSDPNQSDQPTPGSGYSGPDYSAPFTPEGIQGALDVLKLVEAGERIPRPTNDTERRAARETARCLGKVGIFTTQIRQHPGGALRYARKVAPTTRQLYAFGENARIQIDLGLQRAGKEVPAEGLSSYVREVLGAVSAPPIIEEVRLANPDKYDGTVTLSRILLPYDNLAAARDAAFILAGLFAAEKGKLITTELVKNEKVGPGEAGLAVEVLAVTEYDVRDSETAVFELRAEALRRLFGVVFPDDKFTLPELEKDGHTFPPAVRQLLVEDMRTYHRLLQGLAARVTYAGDFAEGAPQAPRIELDPLVHTGVVIFDIWRRAINGARPEDYQNRQRNPDHAVPGLVIGQGIHLTRSRRRPNESRGPLPPIAQSAFERWKLTTIQNAKEHPWKMGFLVLGKALGNLASMVGGTVLVPGAGAVQYLPVVGEHAKHFRSMWRDWEKLKQEADDYKPEIQRARRELQQALAQLAIA